MLGQTGEPEMEVVMRRPGATLCAALILAALTACSPTPDSPVPTPPPSVPSPTPSPTPDEREVAADEAKAAFVDYIRESDRLLHTGGSQSLPASMQRLVTGPEKTTSLAIARYYREKKFRGTGWSRVVNLSVHDLTSSASKTPTATLSACRDQTDLRLTKDGSAFRGGSYSSYTSIEMHAVSGSWKVYETKIKILTGSQTCIGG